MAHAYISYTHRDARDVRLATYLAAYLTEHGHQVFVDQRIRVGQDWPKIVEQELQDADCVIVLLSQDSIVSDMVIHEVSIAYKLKSQHDKPHLLPVRLALRGELPYDLGAMLHRVQHARWEKEGDERDLATQLHQALVGLASSPGGEAPWTQDDASPSPAPSESSPRSSPAQSGADHLAPPSPSFDLRWIERLDAPGGAVRLQSPFYIARRCDAEAAHVVDREGITLRIKGARQMGKSSLLARMHQHARDNHRTSLYLDFQRLDQDAFADLNSLLRYLGNKMGLGFRVGPVPESYWSLPLSLKDRLSEFVQNEILEREERCVTLLLDEVDRVFAYPNLRDDFFSLIRSWHNARAMEPAWNRLNLVLAYSTEAFLFIRDLNESPFNVGEPIKMEDFGLDETEELNRRHGSPITDPARLHRLYNLLAGHPYLTRQAFYALAKHPLSTDTLLAGALDEDGPFAEHLHRYLWRFYEEPELGRAMKEVISTHACQDAMLFYQLRAAGLVRGEDKWHTQPRCELYAQYFGRHV